METKIAELFEKAEQTIDPFKSHITILWQPRIAAAFNECKEKNLTIEELYSKETVLNGSCKLDKDERKKLKESYAPCYMPGALKPGAVKRSLNDTLYWSIFPIDVDGITSFEELEIDKAIRDAGFHHIKHVSLNNEIVPGIKKLRYVFPFKPGTSFKDLDKLVALRTAFSRRYCRGKADDKTNLKCNLFLLPCRYSDSPEVRIDFNKGSRYFDPSALLLREGNRNSNMYMLGKEAAHRRDSIESAIALGKDENSQLEEAERLSDEELVTAISNGYRDVKEKFSPSEGEINGSAAGAKRKGKKELSIQEIQEFFSCYAPRHDWRRKLHVYTDPRTKEQKVLEEGPGGLYFALELEKYKGHKMNPATAEDYFFRISKANKFDSFKERLENIVWDGTPRIRTMLPIDPEQENVEIRQVMLEKWMVGLVARTYRPGAKVDNILVVQGKQGTRKSSFFRALVDDAYFTDSIVDLSNLEDCVRTARGKAVCEFGEMEDLYKKVDYVRMKKFLAQSVDDLREKYAKEPVLVPRTCVFVATTNSDKVLHDPTGNRRYWFIKIKGNIQLLNKEMADQLLGEAVYLYKNGCQWWMDEDGSEDTVSILNENYIVEDPIEIMIAQHLKKQPLGSEGLSLTEMCQKWAIHPDRATVTKLGILLNKLGYKSDRKMVDGLRLTRYYGK